MNNWKISDIYEGNKEALTFFLEEINTDTLLIFKEIALLEAEIAVFEFEKKRVPLNKKIRLADLKKEAEKENDNNRDGYTATLEDFIVSVFLGMKQPISNLYLCEFLALYRFFKEKNKKKF